jgi:AraC-like DNA-binding protein
MGSSVVIPRAEFETRGIRPDDAVIQRLSSSNEALGLLQRYLRSLGKKGIDRTAEFGVLTPVREIVQRHIFDLVSLAVTWRGAVGESNLGSVAAARLQAALDYIAAHFTDPRLSFEMVARSQGISVPYLRDLMGASGHSYVDVVNELRLQKAFNELTEAGPDGRTILEIALAAAFSDISHFNRLFRTRFGDTPSGVRGQNRPRRPRRSFQAPTKTTVSRLVSL